MNIYKKPYFLLFNAITDAEAKLMQLQTADALRILIDAQRDAEELVIAADDGAGDAAE